MYYPICLWFSKKWTEGIVVEVSLTLVALTSSIDSDMKVFPLRGYSIINIGSPSPQVRVRRQGFNVSDFNLKAVDTIGNCQIIMKEKEKHPCHVKLCAFRWLTRKLWHFRGSRFSRCFIPSTSPHCSLSRKVL